MVGIQKFLTQRAANKIHSEIGILIWIRPIPSSRYNFAKDMEQNTLALLP